MAIRFPNLSDSGCKLLVVCGQVESDDKNVLAKFRKGKDIASRYRAGGHITYVRTYFGMKEGKGHMHVDLAQKGFLGKTAKQKADYKPADIQAAFEDFLDLPMTAEVEGYFTVPVSDLPAIIRSATEEARVRDVSIKMTAGTFRVRGAPIDEITWRTHENAPDALISLHARQQMRVQADYLIEALNVIASAFSVFIRGRK